MDIQYIEKSKLVDVSSLGLVNYPVLIILAAVILFQYSQRVIF